MTEVGNKTGAPICKDFGVRGNGFTGKVRWVQIDVGSDAHDHLLPRALVHTVGEGNSSSPFTVIHILNTTRLWNVKAARGLR